MQGSPDFDTDPWRSDIGKALLDAVDGEHIEQITYSSDDVWTATRSSDGSRIAFGDDGGSGWDCTRYDAGDEPVGTDNWTDLGDLAAQVAAFLRA